MSESEVTTEVQFEDSDDLDAFETGFFGRKQAESTDTTKVEKAEQETQTEAEAEADAQTDDEDEAELSQEVKEPPKKKTVQDRIDEVVRQREEIRREAAAEAAKLQQRIEELEKRFNPATPAVTAAEEPQPDALDKDGNPVYGLGEFDPQYIRDLTRFTLNQERAKVEAESAQARRQVAEQEAQQTLQSTWNDKLSEATKEYPDLTEKGQALLTNFNNLDPNYAGYLSSVLMSMDKGPDVLYYLSNHPEEAQSIVNSGAQKATLALGRIESRFLKGEQEAAKPKLSKAPVPPPAKAQSRGSNGAFIAVAPDTEDLDAFSLEFFKPKKY